MAQTTDVYPRCKSKIRRIVNQIERIREITQPRVISACILGYVFKVKHDEQVELVNLKSGRDTIKFKMDLRAEVNVDCKESLQEMILGTRWSSWR